MARVEIVLTGTYQQVAAGVATFTVKSASAGTRLDMNDVAADLAQHSVIPRPNYQIVQTSAVATFARGAGIVLIADDGA